MATSLLLRTSEADIIPPPVIPGSVALEPGRYRSPKTYDDTLEYYKRLFKTLGGVRWRNIVTMPTVRAKHLESLRQKTTWEGLNIYELQGDTRYFVIMRDRPKKGEKSKK